MDDTSRHLCHRCGIPLTEELYGTNSDETLNKDYCRFCFKKGKETGFASKVLVLLDKSIESKTEDVS